MKALTDCEVTILKDDIRDGKPEQSLSSYEYEIAQFEKLANAKADIFFEAWENNGIERTRESERLFYHGFRMAWAHLRQDLPAIY